MITATTNGRHAVLVESGVRDRVAAGHDRGGGVSPAPEAGDEVEGGVIWNVVVPQCLLVHKLLPSVLQTLLVWTQVSALLNQLLEVGN